MARNKFSRINLDNKATKGIPDDQTLRDLAEVWIDIQSASWKGNKLTKDLSPNDIERMVEYYKIQFSQPDLCYKFNLQNISIGVAYLRFSDINSNPRSLPQQLKNVLFKAAQEQVWIPWELVFADAAITGTHTERFGYTLAKKAVLFDAKNIFGLFVDDLGRAARDILEIVHLANSIQELKRVLLAVSDGFDLRLEFSKLTLVLLASLNEHFIDQLRKKVERGMSDAFSQGKIIQKPPVGYDLVPLKDQNDNPVISKNGKIINQRIINQEEAKIINQVFIWYTSELRSTAEIARILNQIKLRNSTWDSGRVMQLLRRSLYAGTEFYGMTKKVKNKDQPGYRTIKIPCDQWKKREVENLRIVNQEIWESTQVRLRESHQAFNSKRSNKTKNQITRHEVYPKTLFYLTCGSCGQPLCLGRSGRYSSYCCLNGINKKHGCKNNLYKSVNVINKVLLDFFKTYFISKSRIKDLTLEVNQFIRDIPEPDKAEVDNIKLEMKKAKTKLNHLKNKMNSENNLASLDSLIEVVSTTENYVKECEKKLAEKSFNIHSQKTKITEKEVEVKLQELDKILLGDIKPAAKLIKQLFGSIVIEKVAIEGHKKEQWKANFTLQKQAFYLYLLKNGDCPTSITSEFPTPSGWTNEKQVEIFLLFTPRYEEIADEVLKLYKDGIKIQNIANMLNTTYWTIKDALYFKDTGKRPSYKRAGKKTGTHSGILKYKLVAKDVSKLRKKNGLLIKLLLI